MQLSPVRFLILCVVAAGPSCSDPERPGETHALRFRFGVASCSSKPVSEARLAEGGRSKLIVLDDKQRSLDLAVVSESPAVVTTPTGTLAVRPGCVELECDVSAAALWLTAVAPGTSRVTFSDGTTGALVDAVTFTVTAPDRLELREYRQTVAATRLTVPLGGSVTVQAYPMAGSEALFASEAYFFSSDGGVVVNGSTKSDPTLSTSVTTRAGAQVGDTGVVTGRFARWEGSVEAVVGAAPSR